MTVDRRAVLYAAVAVTSSSGCLEVIRGNPNGTALRGLHATNYCSEEVTFTIVIERDGEEVYRRSEAVQPIGSDGIPSGTGFSAFPTKEDSYLVRGSLEGEVDSAVTLDLAEVTNPEIWIRFVAGRHGSCGLDLQFTYDGNESY